MELEGGQLVSARRLRRELVVSDVVARLVGLDATTHPRHELTLRNRAEPLTIWVIADARNATVSPTG
jgi:class 3 adenylate cyclase